RLTLGAAADPFGRGVAALGAAVGGTGGLHSSGRHAATLTAGYDSPGEDGGRRVGISAAIPGAPGRSPYPCASAPSSWWKSKASPRSTDSSGVATVTRRGTPPAFSNSNASSRYCPVVRGWAGLVRVTDAPSVPMKTVERAGISILLSDD